MSFLLPLGFLGLLGIGALILIYIIKPNYQQKFISSTYVWKLSLKYRKKNIPINRFRNILIFICQLLILIACALLLARPVILAEKQDDRPEQIAIIDASASMRVSSGDITRFERAVEQVKLAAQKYAEDGGLFSVILADGNAHYLVQRAPAASLDDTLEVLDELVTEGDIKCSYGLADMDGAVSIAETVVNQNPEADVTVYTATTYLDKSGMNIVNVAQKGEWNAAILNAEATLVENFYTIFAQVGYYGDGARKITAYCEVKGVNGTDKEMRMSKSETFDNSEQEKLLAFGPDEQISGGAEQIYSYESIHVYIEESDSFSDDNQVYLYGGIKPLIKIQYASTAPCVFFRNTLFVLRDFVKYNWEVELTEVTKKENIKTEGYDFYLFEGLMPEKMPTDGTVVIFNPGSNAIDGLDIRFATGSHDIPVDSTLAMGTPHPITNKINPEEITISSYWEVLSSEGFDELLYFQGSPVLLVREEKEFTHIVFTFDIHKSSLAVLLEFPLMFISMFNNYIPVTVPAFSYEVGDTVTLNARGETLDVAGPDTKLLIEQFPQQLTVTLPGSYTLNQVVRGNMIMEQFFVKVSAYESNITKEVDALPLLERTRKKETIDDDLLVYFAAALIALLFLEWWLQSRENLR